MAEGKSSGDWLQPVTLALPHKIWMKLSEVSGCTGTQLKLFCQRKLEEIALQDVDSQNEISEKLIESEPDFYIPIFSDMNEAIEFRMAQIKKITEYFGITEMNNFQKYRQTGEFIDFLLKKQQLGEFHRQFNSYKQVRVIQCKDKHTFNRFIGNPDLCYSNGVWLERNWIDKLENLKKNEQSKQRTVKRKTVDEDFKRSIIERLIR